MDRTVVVTLVLLGLCFLPSSCLRLYSLVPTLTTWSEAQSYCRTNYTELAAVRNQQELTELNQLQDTDHYVWIGLRPDITSWTWSLENPDYYSVGEFGFRMWHPGEPSFGFSQYSACAAILKTGTWSDVLCSFKSNFVCYSGTAGAQDTSSSFILVTQSKNWTDAQTYCRTHFTDLASVRNQAENDQITLMLQKSYTLIGLYRNSWKWSDGSPLSVSNWDPGHAPTATTVDTCVVSYSGKWTNINCTTQTYFVCYVDVPDPVIWKQVVQVVLNKPESSVDMEQLKYDILQKFNERLADQNLNEDIKLTWAQQPDGNVFFQK